MMRYLPARPANDRDLALAPYDAPLVPSEPVTFLNAAVAGSDAASDDLANGTITDNPYTLGTQAARDWYAGYNFQMHRELKT